MISGYRAANSRRMAAPSAGERESDRENASYRGVRGLFAFGFSPAGLDAGAGSQCPTGSQPRGSVRSQDHPAPAPSMLKDERGDGDAPLPLPDAVRVESLTHTSSRSLVQMNR